MRQIIFAAVATAGIFSVSQANATPVPGFEALYEANRVACVLPKGTLPACEAAINAHVAALLSGNVELETAYTSFEELRSEVFTENASSEDFQISIDNLFEMLLPKPQAILPLVDTPVGTVTGSDNGNPEPASPQ